MTPENRIKVTGAGRVKKEARREKVTDANDFRTWTDLTGKFSIDAVLIGIKEGKVALRKLNGSRVVLSLDKLSEADQEFIRDTASEKN